MLSKCYGRFMEWWRGYSRPQRNWDTEQVTRVVAVREKTAKDIARETLERYDFCAIHFIERKYIEGLPIEARRFSSKYCPECLEEKRQQQKAERDAAEAVKKIKTDLAISVLKGNNSASSS